MSFGNGSGRETSGRAYAVVLLLAAVASAPLAQGAGGPERALRARTPVPDCDGNGRPDVEDLGAPLPLELAVASLDAVGELLTAGRDDVYPFQGGSSGSTLAGYSTRRSPVANVLGTDLGAAIPYTGKLVLPGDPWFGPGSRYFTAKYTGLFALVAEGMTVDEFHVDPLGRSGSGPRLEARRLSLVFNGVAYTLFAKRLDRGVFPSADELVLVPGDAGGVVHDPGSVLSGEYDLRNLLTGLAGTSRLYYLLACHDSDPESLGLEDEEAEALARAFLEAVVAPRLRDCNANGVPDSCDLERGTSADCDADGVPDECQADCDGDGIPDVCEIALGALDCDADGIPDDCQGATVRRVFLDQAGSLSTATPVRLSFASPPVAVDDVRLLVFYEGFKPSRDFATVSLAGTVVGQVLGGLPFRQTSDGLALDRATFNAFAVFAGAVDLDVSLVQSGSGTTTGTLSAALEIPAAGDCNGNGVLDACDVSSGTSQDLDFDGLPDECETGSVLLRLIPRAARSPLDAVASLPAPEREYREGEDFVVELWASSRVAPAAGLASVQANVVYDRRQLLVRAVEHRPPFLALTGADLAVPGIVADLRGTDASAACPGVGGGWARVAVLDCTALDACVPARLALVQDPAGVSLCGLGPVDPDELSCGAASLALEPPCVYDLDGSGCIDLNDVLILLDCFGLGLLDDGFDPACDLDCNDFVGSGDLSLLLAVEGTCCEELQDAALPPCRRCSPASGGGPPPDPTTARLSFARGGAATASLRLVPGERARVDVLLSRGDLVAGAFELSTAGGAACVEERLADGALRLPGGLRSRSGELLGGIQDGWWKAPAEGPLRVGSLVVAGRAEGRTALVVGPGRAGAAFRAAPGIAVAPATLEVLVSRD